MDIYITSKIKNGEQIPIRLTLHKENNQSKKYMVSKIPETLFVSSKTEEIEGKKITLSKIFFTEKEAQNFSNNITAFMAETETKEIPIVGMTLLTVTIMFFFDFMHLEIPMMLLMGSWLGFMGIIIAKVMKILWKKCIPFSLEFKKVALSEVYTYKKNY